MKNRTIEEIHDKEIGHKKFAWFVDTAIKDGHKITQIKEYNGKIKSIPSCFVASIMNVTAEEYFTATETEKQDATLSFNA